MVPEYLKLMISEDAHLISNSAAPGIRVEAVSKTLGHALLRLDLEKGENCF